MSTTHQGSAEQLSPTQKAFQFADKLNFFFEMSPKASIKSSCINDTLLEYLGIEKYKEFCKNFRTANSATVKDDRAFFKEGFANNPVSESDIVTDHEIKFYWGSIVGITNEVIKLL